MTDHITVREMTAEDWPQVRDIYLAGIETGNATFETSAPSWEGWDTGHLAEHRGGGHLTSAHSGRSTLAVRPERLALAA